MPTLELASGGLRVTYPEPYEVAPQRPSGGRRERGPAGASVWKAPVGPTGAVSGSLLDAFASQGLDLVEPFELVPGSPAGPARGAARPSRTGKVRVALDLPESQNAVILLEREGLFSWRLPTRHDADQERPRDSAAPAGAAERRPPQPAATRVVRFELDVRPLAPARRGARSTPALGPFGDVVVGGFTAYVLKFASGFVPGAVISFLERDTDPGLVVITGDDLSSWKHVDNLSQVALPRGRPAKILLFVHGTFSTTVGSFGVLTTTPEGQQLLQAATGSYDAVIGFDHKTLSRDPLENAVDLHARLAAGQTELTPAIDIVSYSRGALVTRSLIEYVLPPSAWRADIGTVVFVGGTNAGTLLAEPDSWDDFVDLYTNLAAGTLRSVGYATGATPAAEIVHGMVSGIGAFVKYLVWASVTDRQIPGLAAMEPDGPFVTGINGTQPGQPAPGTPWYAVSSDFEPKLYDDRHEPPELPRELVAKLADGLVDQLIGARNDLVVDTASMASVDLPSGGGFIKDSLSFGTNGVVHHLNYFIQPRVCRALMDWLGVTPT